MVQTELRRLKSKSSVDSKVRLSGTNLERAADHNQRVTLHAIRVNGALTRVGLAKITGLTPPAIANIIKRLLNERLVIEAGQLRGGRGQPATRYEIAPDACFSIGLNIDRDHITCVLVNFLGEIVARRSREVAFALPDEAHAIYADWVGELIDEAGIDPGRLVGVGLAIPDDLGAVDLPGRPGGYVEWDRLDLKQLFAEPLHLPVFVENDAAAAAMGEMQFGLGQSSSSFFYILISLALGGGLVIDGNYFRGSQGRSGELGFLIGTGPDGRPEQIQNTVSLSGLRRHLKSRHLNLGAVIGGEAGGKGTAAMHEWLETATALLTEPLVSVSCLINPEAVLIGGRLPGPHLDQLATMLNEALVRHRDHVPAIAPVKRAALAEDAPAVGGAILPFSYFLLPRDTSLWKTPSVMNAGDAG